MSLLTNPPINRSERYWTATVLPGLIAARNFRELHRFLSLVDKALGTHPPEVPIETSLVRFETEYSLKLAEAPGRRRGELIGVPAPRGDTPDMLVWLHQRPTRLYAVEAKLFDACAATDLRDQLKDQERYALDPLATRYEVSKREIRHVALVPREMAGGCEGAGVPFITWEDVRDEFRDQQGTYFWQVLSLALDGFSDLVGLPHPSNRNSQGQLTGEQIVEYYKTDKSPRWVGRQGGETGELFQGDLAMGGWRTRSYQITFESERPSANWFTVELFVAAIQDQETGTTQ